MTAAPPLLQTTNATVGATVESKEVRELPILGRNFTRALLIAPGVSAVDSSDTYNRSVAGLAVNPSFYGQRQRNNNFTLDGVGNKDALFQHINLSPPLEAIAELKIESVWMNVYHGGTARAKSDLSLFIDNVVVARKYIGPLQSADSVAAGARQSTR